jgi:hypothetical protein
LHNLTLQSRYKCTIDRILKRQSYPYMEQLLEFTNLHLLCVTRLDKAPSVGWVFTYLCWAFFLKLRE